MTFIHGMAASKGKVPTEIMIKRRNFSSASRCVMCFHEEELVDHLFVTLSMVLFIFGFGSFLDGR